MKELLVSLAAYNRDANVAMTAILGQLPEDLLKKEVGVYYRSILGTLEHIAHAELGWLKRYATFFEYRSLDAEPLITEDILTIKARINGEIGGTVQFLRRLDALFIEFVRELRQEELSTRVRYRNMRGEELERVYWQTIIHVLNHATHHRGEISAVLDQNGIANDYSGFTLYTK